MRWPDRVRCITCGCDRVSKITSSSKKQCPLPLPIRAKLQAAVHGYGSIENFWSLLKRGVIGQYHQVSVKHLHRYLDEFPLGFNN